MTADWGYLAREASESQGFRPNAPRAQPSLTLLSRQMLADDDALWDAVGSREQELQQVLKKPDASADERRAARADLESIAWFAEQWRQVQHDVRCIKDFGHWLRTPLSREKLFANFCRHAIPTEWDRYAAERTPPFIFPTREKLHAHLQHCQLCDAQRQLAEGRKLRAAPDRPTWGDRLMHDFVATFAGESVAAACDPATTSRDAANELRVWSDAPIWRLALPAGARLAPKSDLLLDLPLRLAGPPAPARLEVRVTVQFIDQATRQAESPWAVYPPEPGRESLIEWNPQGEGTQRFSTTIPVPAAPGRLIVRYAVRAATASRAAAPSYPLGKIAVNALAINWPV